MIHFIECLEPRQLLSAVKAPVTPPQSQIDANVVQMRLQDFHQSIERILAIASGERSALGRDLNSLRSRPDELLFVGIRRQVNDEIHLVQTSAAKWLAGARAAVADAKVIDLRLLRHPGDVILLARLAKDLGNFDEDGPDVLGDDNDLDDSDDVDAAINAFFGAFSEAENANPGNVRIMQDVLSGNSSLSTSGTNVNAASQQFQSAFDTFNSDSQTLIQ